jgi:hypothetical protein
VWLNLSQEALTAVDELREHGMVRAVRMYTVDYKTITAYQVRKLQFHCILSFLLLCFFVLWRSVYSRDIAVDGFYQGLLPSPEL